MITSEQDYEKALETLYFLFNRKVSRKVIAQRKRLERAVFKYEQNCEKELKPLWMTQKYE